MWERDEIEQVIARLREYAAELDDDRGCEHTASFGEWCVRCREDGVQAMRTGADELEALLRRSRAVPPEPLCGWTARSNAQVRWWKREGAETIVRHTAFSTAADAEKFAHAIAEIGKVLGGPAESRAKEKP